MIRVVAADFRSAGSAEQGCTRMCTVGFFQLIQHMEIPPGINFRLVLIAAVKPRQFLIAVYQIALQFIYRFHIRILSMQIKKRIPHRRKSCAKYAFYYSFGKSSCCIR